MSAAPKQTAREPAPARRFNLPLALTLGGMITLGIITTSLGFLFWPEPKTHEDTSTEGWPDGYPGADAPGPARPDAGAQPGAGAGDP